MVQSYLTHLECTNCGATYDFNQLMRTCPACGKVIYPRYDLDAAKDSMTPDALLTRPWNLWRYREVMPIQDLAYALTLGEGGTALLHAPSLGSAIGVNHLLIKDEGTNPTGSFKARGLGAAVSRAAELGVKSLAIPSAGNAAAAMSAYAARAGIAAYVFMPADAPSVMKAECEAYGAHVFLVDGLINDAGKIVSAGAEAGLWFPITTLCEPYRVEGKKTMGIEIAEQLNWRLPDAIVYPTGGGTGIVGMWKGFEELEAMGLIGSHRPRMIVVQAENCAPIVRAFEEGERHARLWNGASTVAPGIRVPVAIGDYLILDAVRKSSGTAVTVSDAEIIHGVRQLATTEGLFVSPEVGAVVAAAANLRASEFLNPNDEVLLLATGSGLMHTDLIEADFPVLSAADPNVLDRIMEAAQLVS